MDGVRQAPILVTRGGAGCEGRGSQLSQGAGTSYAGTVSPETSTERSEVAAAVSIASSSGCPAARSSRCRLTQNIE